MQAGGWCTGGVQVAGRQTDGWCTYHPNPSLHSHYCSLSIAPTLHFTLTTVHCLSPQLSTSLSILFIVYRPTLYFALTTVHCLSPQPFTSLSLLFVVYRPNPSLHSHYCSLSIAPTLHFTLTTVHCLSPQLSTSLSLLFIVNRPNSLLRSQYCSLSIAPTLHFTLNAVHCLSLQLLSSRGPNYNRAAAYISLMHSCKEIFVTKLAAGEQQPQYLQRENLIQALLQRISVRIYATT